MTDLRTRALGTFSEIRKGKKPESVENLKVDETYKPYILIDNFDGSFTDFTNDGKCLAVEEEDIVIVWDGASAGLVSTGHFGYLGSTLASISVLESEFYSKFIFYSLQLQEAHLRYQSQGTGIPHIAGDVLANTHVLDIPAAQQEKIADILTSVDDTIEHTQAQVAKLQDLKTATMNELLTRGIGHTEFRESELGLIPTTWETKKLGAVVEIQSGQVDPTEKPFSDLPHIGSGNMVSWTGQLVDVCSASQAGQISGKYHFSKRHILYSKVRPNLAKACYPKYEGVCSADTYPLMPDEVINGDFLLQYLLTETFTRSATEISARTGMPKINREDLNMISVPIPPLVEQEKIAEILTSLDDQIESVELKLVQLESLKKSLMGDLLTGRVRVSVD